MKKYLAIVVLLALLVSIGTAAYATNAKGHADIKFISFDGIDDGVYDPDDGELDDERLPEWMDQLSGMSLPFGQHEISIANEVYDSLIGVPVAGQDPDDENAITGGTGVLVVGMRSGEWKVQLTPIASGFRYTQAAINDESIRGQETLKDYRLSLQLDKQWATQNTKPVTVSSHTPLLPDTAGHITGGFTFAGYTDTILDNTTAGDLGVFGANFNAQLFAPAASVTVAGEAQTILDWTFVLDSIRE
ncbi:MAG: hypothetical protein FWC13_01340 [Oscillospiraceae bacterium]|nr:hypothetical protein [Oscillospiraceae bacterium]